MISNNSFILGEDSIKSKNNYSRMKLKMELIKKFHNRHGPEKFNGKKSEKLELHHNAVICKTRMKK